MKWIFQTLECDVFSGRQSNDAVLCILCFEHLNGEKTNILNAIRGKPVVYSVPHTIDGRFVWIWFCIVKLDASQTNYDVCFAWQRALLAAYIPLVVFVWYFFGQYDTNPITSHGVWCCDGVDRRRRRRRLQCGQHVWKGVHIVCQRAHCTLWFCWHAVFTEVFVQTQFSGQSLQEDVEACGCLCSRPDRDEEAVTTCSNDCYL